MALPFLKSETEENATQAIAFIGICIMTVGLTVMNVTGAIAGSEGTSPGQWIIRGALAVILSGAELLAAVVLVRVMLAANWWRRAVGALIFIGIAWACIQNGKRAVHLVYPEFKESAALLRAKADIAEAEAADLAGIKAAAIKSTPDELRLVRERIAKLEGEQELMTAKSPEKIMEAQALLTASGDYFGRIDGKREELTEAAMRARGEEISNDLANLRRQETNLAAGAPVALAPVATSGLSAAERRADLEDRARKAASAAIWLEVMLWVFEAARSFGLWALVATITAAKPKEDEAPADATIAALTDAEREELDRLRPAPGEVVQKMPQADWDALLAAKAVHENIKAGAAKAAGTKAAAKQRDDLDNNGLLRLSAPNDSTLDEVRRTMRHQIQTRLIRLWEAGLSIEQIAVANDTTVDGLMATYRAYLSPEEARVLFEAAADDATADEAHEDAPAEETADDPANPADVEEPEQYVNGLDLNPPEPPASDDGEPDARQ